MPGLPTIAIVGGTGAEGSGLAVRLAQWSMRKLREVLRLKYACGASDRVIARSVGIQSRAEVIACRWRWGGGPAVSPLVSPPGYTEEELLRPL